MDSGSRRISHSLTKSEATHESVTEEDELRTGKRFGEDVGELIMSGDVLDRYGVGDDVGPKMVKADGEVLGTGTSPVIRGNFDAAFVVFEDGAVHGRGFDIEFEATGLEFAHEVHETNDFTESRRKGNIFGFGRGESN